MVNRARVCHALCVRPVWRGAHRRMFALRPRLSSVALAGVLLGAACGPTESATELPAAGVPAATDAAILRYVTSARQVGPVAYRDPLGAISPDGALLAYTNDRYVNIVATSGGAVRQIGAGRSDLRYLTWMGNSRHLAVQERAFDRSGSLWFRYDVSTGERTPLWPDHPETGSINQLSWSSDGSAVVGAAREDGASRIVRLDPAIGEVTEVIAEGPRLSFPAWTPDGGVACLSLDGRSQELQLTCGQPAEQPGWSRDVYGRFAFSADGQTLYYGSPNPRGRLDLWSREVAAGSGPGPATRLSTFERDAYSPSVSADGTVIFKSQDYRLFIATAPADGGETTQVTTFMSETPMWDWSSTKISFTWGDWRRQIDDIHYPDISQHIGFVDLTRDLPAAEPTVVVRQSESEDQSMHWSPNGKWIVFHSHLDGDDIWLVPADGSAPAVQITEGGSETGWPRWSPDGRWIQYPSYTQLPGGGRSSDLYLIGIDQETGAVTSPTAPIDLEGFPFDAMQGEWLGGSDEIVFESAEGPDVKGLYRVSRSGGVPRLIHRFETPQVFAGLGASPDGKWVAYVAPGADGWLQIFRVSSSGGVGEPITFDPSDKTQPAYSPDGTRIAFTVFSYLVHFWAIDPADASPGAR